VRSILLAAVALGATACTQIDNTLAAVPVFAFLREAPFIDPYEMPRNAPPGSVPFASPVGRVLPPIEPSEAGLNAFAATAWGRSPYAHVATDTAWVNYGQAVYANHCAVCHGPSGQGDGPIVGQGSNRFPAVVPSLVQGAALGRSEGYVYGIIRVGRGLMPAYGGRTTDRERWAVVNYVETLQRGGGAAPAAPQPQPAATDTAAAASTGGD
jgi:mono/diheme cytochrome c family protein